MFSRLGMFAALAVVALAASACSTPSYSVNVGRRDWLVDDTSVSQGLAQRQYRKIMVVPPSGTVRGTFEGEMALVEAEFLKRNMIVFSPALTARVVTTVTEKGKGADSGTELSDVERALILAKEANAEAILQIGTLAWIDNGSRRYFIWDENKRSVAESDKLTYERTTAHKWWYSARLLTASGRLIDVVSGEVMATFRIEGSAFNSLPETYTSTWAPNKDNDKLLDKVAETGDYDGIAKRAEIALQQEVFSRLAQHIAGGSSTSR